MRFLQFFYWHYILGWGFVLKATLNFIHFAFHFFSIRFLLRTLLAPWRRVEMVKRSPGFSFEDFFYKLTFNLISRTIGFLVRFTLIIWGLLLALVFIVLGLCLLVVWVFIPFLTWPIFLVETKPKPKSTDQLIRGEARDFVLKRLNLKSLKELKDVKKEDLEEVAWWYWQFESQRIERKRFWEKDNLLRIHALGTNLAFGFTLELDKYTSDMSFPTSFTHQLVGRKKEIGQIITVLIRRMQNNVLLVGEPGVGKRTILLGLAKAIRENRVAPALFYKRVLFLDMNLVVGKKTSVQQAVATFELLLKEAYKAGNVILVIDHIERYISGEHGADLTSAFTAIAQNAKIQLIGITTPDAYEKVIFTNEEFLKYFDKVEVQPPNKKEALRILELILPDYERGKNIITTLEALKAIVNQSDTLISDIPFPEKAIDLLDQLITQMSAMKKKIILKKDVDRLMSEKIKVPVGSLSLDEKIKLKNLDPTLHKRVVDQNQAIEALVKAMQRARAGVGETDKPIGTFLFMGPTGVGKTETAKALAEAYFTSEKQIVRFDMSQPFDLKLFYQRVREKPFAVLLLDEFEKADKKTLHLFLTVFDEGYIKDDHGKTVSFKNMVIICTSNAGAEFIREQIKKDSNISFSKFQSIITEYVLKQHIFSPELLNRYDGVIVYRPLTTEDVEKIAKLLMEKLKKRLAKKEIGLACGNQVYSLLAKEGHSFEFGARPLKRLIANKIETVIAQMILDEKIKKGDTLKVSVDSSGKEFTINT